MRRLLTAGVALVLCWSVDLAAQATTANVAGTVVDESGAIVPGATVAIVNLGTALRRQATTSGEGRFALPLLPPGRYTLTTELTGFSTSEVPDLTLNVGDELSLVVRLKVAGVGETVRVTAEPSRINTSPAVGTVVDRQFVENIPLNGRSFQSLIALTPGLVVTTTSYENQGQFSVNGQRANANYFTVDGVSANIGVGLSGVANQETTGTLPGLTASGGTTNLVSLDAMQEFRIQTSTFAPEFGRTPGGQISIVTRSGTNALHGSASEYFRNDALDANDWFANNRGLPKPPMHQNDYGAVLGGPIVKNRTFFFASYEGLRLELPQVITKTVPSASARASSIPAIGTFFNGFPIPNGRDFGNGTAEFTGSYADPSNVDSTSVRIDHSMGPRLQVFGRFSNAPSNTVVRGSGTDTLNSVAEDAIDTRTFTTGATMSLSNSLTNELRANWSRTRALERTAMDDFGGAVVPPTSALLPSFAPADGTSGFSFTITGVGVLRQGGNGDNTQRQFNVVDALSYARGNHQIKAGVDYRRLTPIASQLRYSLGATFGTVAAAAAGTATSVSVFRWTDPREMVLDNVSAFGQDTYRTTDRLTLTYGLRWEFNTPPTERNNRLLTLTGIDNPATIQLAPAGTPLWEPTVANFAPRFGAAYQLSQRSGGETILRGGLGVFYDLGTGQAAAGAGAGSFPVRWGITYQNVPFPIAASLADTPAPPTVPLASNGAFLIGFSPDLKLPRTYQFNIGVERAIGLNQTLTVTYVGAIGHELLRLESFQSPNPSFVLAQIVRNAAESNYHSLQLQYQRRLSRGLQALASYTLARSRDNASSDAVALVPSQRLDPALDMSYSDFDVRHSASAAIVYNLPEAGSGVARTVFGGWSLDGIYRARSATPVNVTSTRNLGFGSAAFRPDLVPDTPLYIDDPTAPGGQRFNRAAFFIPADRQGTLPRNALRGFPAWQVDLALRRQFAVTARISVRLGLEVFNVLNHPNFANPSGNLSSSLFGASTTMLGRGLGSGGLAGGFSPLYQIGGPRSIQLVAKASF